MRFRRLNLVFIVLLFTIDGFTQLPSISFGNSGNASGCAPHSVTFNISSFSGNTPNTTYQLNFGDGSPVLNYTQATIPTSVNHTFSSITCGQTYGGQQNCFGATVTATNSSGSTSGSVFPIRISKKPNASFSLSQSASCAGSTITFSNISDHGVTYTGSVCNTNTPFYWAVTGPSLGTVVSGSLGSNGSFPSNSNAWTAGSSSLDMQFTTPGNYQMKLSIGNSCGIDDTTLSFTVVNSSPSISLGSNGNSQQCAPASFDFPIANFEANSAETIYTVTYGDGGATQVFNHPPPSVVSHIFSESSCGYTTPLGLSDAFWVQISAQNACASSISTIEPIRISTPPNANYVDLPNSACNNYPIVLTSSADLGTNVSASGCNTNHGMVWSISPTTGWSLSSGNLGSTNGFPSNYLGWTNGSDQLSIVFSIPGNYSITQRIRNSCGEDLETQTVTITSSITIDAGLNQSTCIGSSPIQLTGIPAGGLWSGSAFVTASGVFSPNAVGLNSLLYTIGSGSCLVSDEIDILVNPLPNVAFVLEDNLLCTSNAPIVLNSGNPSGGVYSGSGVNGDIFDPSLASVGQSSIEYSYVDVNGCSNSDSAIVTVEICTWLSNSYKINTVNVYPNPSLGVLNIQLQNECSSAEMFLFSVDGQLIFQKQLIASNQNFDFSNLSSGVYYIRLRNKDEIISLPWYKFN